jgi:hypothetical protein
MPSLPDGFIALEPFVARFAVAGTANRAALRGQTAEAERQAFFDTAKPLINPALDFLDSKPLNALSPSEQTLLNLTLAFTHIALAVEIQGPDEEKHAKLRAHMKIVASPADERV